MSIQKYLLCSELDRKKLAVLMAMKRDELKLSKKFISTEWNLTTQSINNIEKGIPVNESNLVKYLKALGMDIEMKLIERKKEE